MTIPEQPVKPGIYVIKDDAWDQEGWTSVPNAVLRDSKLSWDAKAAFGWLASHSRRFALNAESLAAAGPKGRNHAREMLRELEQYGWLTRHKERNPSTGRYDVFLYHLHPVQVGEADRTYSKSTAKTRKFPQVSPGTGQSGAGAEGVSDGLFEEFEREVKAQVSPETGQSGAGQPGAGQPAPGQSGVSRARLSLPKNTRGEDHKERETPAPPTRALSLASVEEDPFSEPPADVDPFEVDLAAAKRKTSYRRRKPSAIADTARSQAADRIVNTYIASLPVGLPYVERIALAQGVDECLDLGWSEADIVERGLPHWNASGKGANLFARIAAEVVARRPGGKEATTTTRFRQHVAEHHQMFNPDGSWKSRPGLDQGRVTVEAEVLNVQQQLPPAVHG